MANFDTIKTAIDANINTNGTQDITGAKMNSILHQMVDATDEQLTELESKVDGQYYDVTSASVAQGYISGDNGTHIYSDSISLYDERYFPMRAGEAIEFSSNDYAIQILAYDENKTFKSSLRWFAKNFNGFVPTTDGYFRMSLRKADASTFSPSEMSNLTIRYSEGLSNIVAEMESEVFGDYDKIKVVNVAQGYIGSDNGTKIYVDVESLYDSRYFPMTEGKTISIDNDNYLVQILAYDTSKTFKATLYWFAKDLKDFIPPYDGYFRIGFRKEDKSAFPLSEFSTITLNYSDSLSKKIADVDNNVANLKNEVSEVISFVAFPSNKAFYNGYYSDTDGVSLKGSNDGASVVNSTYMRVNPNAYYTIMGNHNAYKVALYYYDRNKAFISCAWFSQVERFSTPQDCYYIRIGLRNIPLTVASLDALIRIEENHLVGIIGDLMLKGMGDVYHYGMSAVSNREEVNEIPSQSIYDIRFAKEAGYKCIEANLHITRDGYYVVTHGKNGTLGHDFSDLNGNDAFGVVISDTDFATLRANYRYYTPIAEYQIPITTLEDFCREAKRCGIAVMLQYKDEASIEIARGILGDNMLFMYDAPRNVYSGLIAEYKYFNTIDAILERCRAVGKPYIYSVDDPFKFDEATLKELCNRLHAEGFYVMSAYQNDENMAILRGYGFDLFAVSKKANVLADNQKIVGGKILTFHDDGSVTWGNL